MDEILFTTGITLYHTNGIILLKNQDINRVDINFKNVFNTAGYIEISTYQRDNYLIIPKVLSDDLELMVDNSGYPNPFIVTIDSSFNSEALLIKEFNKLGDIFANDGIKESIALFKIELQNQDNKVVNILNPKGNK